jgi:cytoskeletal protein CcmA (bactofilin family)
VVTEAKHSLAAGTFLGSVNPALLDVQRRRDTVSAVTLEVEWFDSIAPFDCVARLESRVRPTWFAARGIEVKGEERDVGLLTRIFGNRGDGEEEGLEENLESDPMREPDGAGPAQGPEVAVDTSSPAAAAPLQHPPSRDEPEIVARVQRQAESVRRARRATQAPHDASAGNLPRPVQQTLERAPRGGARSRIPVQPATLAVPDATSRERRAPAQPVARRGPTQARVAGASGGKPEREMPVERAARPTVRESEGAPNHSFLLTRTPRHLHPGENVSASAAGVAARQKASGTSVSPGGASAGGVSAGVGRSAADGMRAGDDEPTPRGGGAHSLTSSAGGEDPEEIDVSDQLEAVDNLDTSDDLDAFDDLILDDEDEETNPSVSLWAAGVSSAEDTGVRVAVPEEPVEASPLDVAEGAQVDLQQELPNSPAARGLGADAWEEPGQHPGPMAKPDPERMPREMQPTKHTLVEAGTELEGTLDSSCPVVIKGSFAGKIDAPSLSIETGGLIVGTVTAKRLRSLGTLSGTIDAGEVFVSGAVRSRTVIKAKRLELKIDASDDGPLELRFGTCDLELSDVANEPDPDGSLFPSTAEDGDSFDGSGWDLADPEEDSSLTATSSARRSASMSSWLSEGSNDDTKTRRR